MSTVRKAPCELSPSEKAIAERAAQLRSSRDLFPIKDPNLAEVMELLHRMAACHDAVPVQWMAGDAITKLRVYVRKLEND
ncbi:hypothetical protein [Paraburkholderia sp.]|uniref:hypothetical protein n=1 Tax=Paraburkholderia sp. TaxID=1926495 RepID=UPI003C7A054E